MIQKKDRPERLPLGLLENTALVAALVALPFLAHPKGSELALPLLAFATLAAVAGVAEGVLARRRTLGRRLCLCGVLALSLYLALRMRGDWPDVVRELVPGFLRDVL